MADNDLILDRNEDSNSNTNISIGENADVNTGSVFVDTSNAIVEGILNGNQNSLKDVNMNLRPGFPWNKEKKSIGADATCSKKLKTVCDDVEIIGEQANQLAEEAQKFAELTSKDADRINEQVSNVKMLCNYSNDALELTPPTKDEHKALPKTKKKKTRSVNSDSSKDISLLSNGFIKEDEIPEKSNDYVSTSSHQEDQNKSDENSIDINVESTSKDVKKLGIFSSILGGITGIGKNTSSPYENGDLKTENETAETSSLNQRREIGFVDFRAATEEATQLKERLEEAKELAIKTKELTEEALNSSSILTDEEKRHQTSLIKYLNGSADAVETTQDFIDDAKDSADAVLEPHLTNMERIKRAMPKIHTRDVGFFCCGVGCGMGCGFILGMMIKNIFGTKPPTKTEKSNVNSYSIDEFDWSKYL